jgi:hypothetical protein
MTPPRAVRVERCSFGHGRCCLPQHVKSAKQVDADNGLELGLRHGLTYIIEGPSRTANAGRVHQHPQRRHRHCLGDNRCCAFCAANVASDKNAANLGRHRSALRLLQVHHDHPRSKPGKLTRPRRSNTRGPSSYYCRCIRKIHPRHSAAFALEFAVSALTVCFARRRC